MEELSTAVNCDKTGHCPHEGTAKGTFYCCRCGVLLYEWSIPVISAEEYKVKYDGFTGRN